MKKAADFVRRNAAAVALVLVFFAVYLAAIPTENAMLYFGAVDMEHLNGEYYRWFTCLFLHYNLRHLLANSIGLLAVSSLLSSFLGKGKLLFLFLVCGVAAEAAYSVVAADLVYDVGASSGVFALIACLLVCCLRFPGRFRLPWYRPDVLVVLVYFVFANSSVSAFLVHTFGFAAGVLLSFVMAMTGQLDGRAPSGRKNR